MGDVTPGEPAADARPDPASGDRLHIDGMAPVRIAAAGRDARARRGNAPLQSRLVTFLEDHLGGGGDESRAVAAIGELSIHGHARSVSASGRIGLPGPGLLSPENRVGLELAATVDRRDFGLDRQEELPGGGDTLGWDVTLEALLELVEQ